MNQSDHEESNGWRLGSGRTCLAILLLLAGAVLTGCRSAQEHREKADEVAAEIIEAKQQEALGKTEPFSIERPSDLLRRRLLIEQGLLFADEASLGTDRLERIPHWPKDNYPVSTTSPDAPAGSALFELRWKSRLPQLRWRRSCHRSQPAQF